MVKATNLGYPRIGPKRELNAALEGYWAGTMTADGLAQAARRPRLGVKT